MGLMDRIKGTSSGSIQVSVEPTAAAPGSEMTIRVLVNEEPDKKARALVAGVTCTGRYQVKERHKDSNDSVQTREVWQSVEIYEQELPLEVRTGEQQVKLTLPAHVQPSSDGVVEWEVWARLDRDNGLDVVEKRPFEVRVPLEQVPATRTDGTSEDGLTLSGLPTAAKEGDAVQGTLVVDVTDEITARAVSVRLHRRVTYVAEAINDYNVYSGNLSITDSLIFGSSSRITHDTQVAEIDLVGKETFAPGQRKELPFSIAVPGSGPTSSHPYAQVDWRLEAVLDRRLRGDKSVETPLIVV
jgi:hypothetical protein